MTFISHIKLYPQYIRPHRHHAADNHKFYSCSLSSIPTSTCELNFDSSDSECGSVVDENPSATTPNTSQAEPLRPTPPFRWLHALLEHGVVLCNEHRVCFTPGEHL